MLNNIASPFKKNTSLSLKQFVEKIWISLSEKILLGILWYGYLSYRVLYSMDVITN